MKYNIIPLILLLFSCTAQENNYSDKAVIPVTKAIGSGTILNLSDYAQSVSYIPLETNDSVLIGSIGSVLIQNNAYLIKTYQPGQSAQCLLFDKTGKFVRQIGTYGQGPKEYTFINYMDLHPAVNHIFLDHRERYIEYGLDGDVQKIIRTPICPGKTRCWDVVQMSDSTYLSTLVSPTGREYKAILFGENGNTIKLYPNYFHREKIGIDKKSFGGSRDGKIYRYKDQIRYWRSWDDTIFTFDRNQDIQVAYRFDLGKYKAPMEWMSSYRKDYDITNYVYPQGILESDRYLFLNFACGRNAPEKFEYVLEGSTPMGRRKRSLVNVSVYGLFDKQTGDLVLLNQPIKRKQLGFRNDLDGGPIFWPKYISPDEKMITWWPADQFLEIYGALPNPSAELRAVAKKLKPDDNPVLMVVQLK